MLIKFKKIVLNNFLSFGNSELDLSNSGYTLISGVNNNVSDMAKSNGSGKSSIWEAISWSLTGKTIRECKNVTNIYANDGAYVELYFSVDTDEYHIIRSKDHSTYKTNLKIYVNGEDKSGKGIKDSEKLLADYLPDLTSTLLGSVIILGQGLPQRFSNNTPSGRKDILEKLSKSDFMIEDIKARLTARKNQLNIEIRGFEDGELANKVKLGMLQDSLKDLNSQLDELNATDYNQKIADLTPKVQSAFDKVTQTETEIADVTTRIEQYQTQLLEAQQLLQESLDSITEEYEPKVTNLKDAIRTIDSQLSVDTAELTRLQNIKDVCPTCGQKLPNIHKPDTSELEGKIAQLETKKKELSTTLSETYDTVKSLRRIAQNDHTSNSNAIVIEQTKAKGELQTLKSNLSELQATHNKLSVELVAAQVCAQSVQGNIESVKSQIASISVEIDSISEKMLYNISRKEESQKRLDAVNKMYMIAIRDFRGFLLANIIDFINGKSKEYCQDIFETDKIEFILEDNNINIFYDNKQYENLSGGEKQKVDLIVQFSIRDMLCKFLNFSSNIIVLDEIFDNLDSVGCTKVLNVISKRLTDIDNIYIVTHHADIDLPIDNEIVVIKNEYGISEIQQ